MKQFRKSFSKVQLILDFKWKSILDDFTLGIRYMKLPGFKPDQGECDGDEFEIKGFHAISIGLAVVELTINIEDNRIEIHSNEDFE